MFRRRHRARLSALPPLAALAAVLALAAARPAPASAQSAEEIVDRAIERYEQRMEGVQSYTVVQEVMGFESTTTLVRKTVDGHTVFVPEKTGAGGAAEQAPQSYGAMLAELGKRATVEGTETVGGRECHVLAVTDFSGGAFGQYAPGDSDDEWTPERLRMYIDREELLPRKLVMEGTTTVKGEKRPVTFTALLKDYREVDGVVHPFLMEVHTEGMGSSMTPEQKARMKKALEKMEQMPEEQRKMMEKMMGEQMKQMKKMLASGSMDFTVEVKEIRVNEAGG